MKGCRVVQFVSDQTAESAQLSRLGSSKQYRQSQTTENQLIHRSANLLHCLL